MQEDMFEKVMQRVAYQGTLPKPELLELRRADLARLTAKQPASAADRCLWEWSHDRITKCIRELEQVILEDQHSA